MLAAAAIAGSVLVVPAPVSAEGLFDLFFGGAQKQQGRQAPPQANFFADPFGLNQQPERQQSAPASAPRVAGSGPAYCVRSCDGKYFPLTMRGVDKATIDKRVREASRILALDPLLDRRPAELSGGQRQRVA
ncbi:MAG: DUF2865 domain-containing protein, partial [Bradyrhizobium sp.]|uniref:DUF2865 domain-containing protein n=1 Tax=Bradyrhizobium sp. TaxID=376 RepID=UPI0025BEAF09